MVTPVTSYTHTPAWFRILHRHKRRACVREADRSTDRSIDRPYMYFPLYIFFFLKIVFWEERKDLFLWEDIAGEGKTGGKGGWLPRGRTRRPMLSRKLRALCTIWLQLRPLPPAALWAFSTLSPFLFLPLFVAIRLYGTYWTSQKSREFRRRQTGASWEIRQDTWVAFAELST